MKKHRNKHMDFSAREIEAKVTMHENWICGRTDGKLWIEEPGIVLDFVDLRGRNLSGVVLRGVSLKRALLDGGDFIGADLSGTNLENASLKATELTGCNFQDANLSHANLQGSNLTNCNFRNANLNNANLQSCDLTAASLEGVTIRDTLFTDAILDRDIHYKLQSKEALYSESEKRSPQL